MDISNYRMVMLSSCDEGYFPLVKGLFLSLLQDLPPEVELAFLDLGCSDRSLSWLRDHGVKIVSPDHEVLGQFGDARYGYHRAQICRPFLPRLFPDADVLSWIDCDTWFQDTSILPLLMAEALAHPEAVLAAPEIHHTYSQVNNDAQARQAELFGYYAPLFGDEIARKYSIQPTINSGFLVMHRDCPVWRLWGDAVTEIYGENFDRYDPLVRHFAEQVSLNKLIHDGAKMRSFDPAYNYLCLWTFPHRDEGGTVRISAPPFTPLGMLHLAGGWKHFGRRYYDAGLLYRSGAYLSQADRDLLLTDQATETFR